MPARQETYTNPTRETFGASGVPTSSPGRLEVNVRRALRVGRTKMDIILVTALAMFGSLFSGAFAKTQHDNQQERLHRSCIEFGNQNCDQLYPVKKK